MNIEEFKTACETFEKVKLEAFRVMKAYYCDVDDPYEDIINVDVEKDEVVVYYTYTDYDGYNYNRMFDYFNFPISWIALNDEELDEAIAQHKNAIKLQEEIEKREKALKEKAKEEAKEKTELARLKAKYEQS